MSTNGDTTRWMAAMAGAVASYLVLAPGCRRPVVGEPVRSSQVTGGASVEITGASVDATGRVLVRLNVKQGGVPLSLEAARALAPTFTLAALSAHPVDGLAAWKSLLLTGSQTAPSLPPGGPGTPQASVIANARQPGSETDGALAGADGDLTYAFANALPAGFDPQETLRVGVYLAGAAVRARETAATHDFRPAGGAAAPRDTVLDENCNRCHGTLRAPCGRGVGVKLCLTCHTWQHSDPDTVDPAAMGGATSATDPNPLELGRLVHRIHRGKYLPTQFQAAPGGNAVPAPSLPSASALPLPFSPSRTTGTGASNLPIVGRKFAVVGEQSRERVYAQVTERRDLAGANPRSIVAGVNFPRDLRECDVCHDGAPQEYEVLYGISRRTCHGCHPEVWFEATPITDAVHFAHPGGPKADDTACRSCHVVSSPPQKLYAPLSEIHVVPRNSPRFSMPVLEIVSVSNLVAGGAPTVRFKVRDRAGYLASLSAPVPASESGPGASPVPRALSYFRIQVAGPAAPDYPGPVLPIGSNDAGNPSPLALVADAEGVFTYTFASTLPPDASGTWSVALEARRRATPTHYDTATDTFAWPYTGEAITESPDNPAVYVDSAVGEWPGGSPVPRRTTVVKEKCLRCHGRIETVHGGVRHDAPVFCVTCHTPDRTEWATRPKVAAGSPNAGNVNLAATYDGIEERTTHFTVLVHRIHTGRRQGSAMLDAGGPHLVFLDRGRFPNDLANCTLCHVGRSYDIDAIPANARPTRANETGTIQHAASGLHAAGEPSIPPVLASCIGCHGTRGTRDHAARYTPGTVEQCAGCHARGSFGMDVAHGLAAPAAAAVEATYSSIAERILAPRCASAACHGGSPPAAFPRLDPDAAWAALVDQPSQQASGVDLVEPFAPERSYLLLKVRGEAGSVGGIGTVMPMGDAALTASEIAAIEAWIASGAPND